MVLFIMMYKLVLTFQSVDESLVCDFSIEAIEYFVSAWLFSSIFLKFNIVQAKCNIETLHEHYDFVTDRVFYGCKFYKVSLAINR